MVRPKEMSKSQPSSLIWIESGFRFWAPLTCKLICWNAHFVPHFCRLDPWLLKALVLQATYFSSVHPLGLIGLVQFGQDLPFALQKPLYDVADSRTRELGGGGGTATNFVHEEVFNVQDYLSKEFKNLHIAAAQAIWFGIGKFTTNSRKLSR